MVRRPPSSALLPATAVSGAVVGRFAVDLEAVCAIERGELQRLAEAARLSKDHVARPGQRAIRVGVSGPDEQVGEAVAIDVARRAHAVPGDVAGRFAVDLAAVVAIEPLE